MRFIDFNQKEMYGRFGGNILPGDLIIHVSKHLPGRGIYCNTSFDVGMNKKFDTKCVSSVSNSHIAFTDGEILSIREFMESHESYKFYHVNSGDMEVYRPVTELYYGFSSNFNTGDIIIISVPNIANLTSRINRRFPDRLELEILGGMLDMGTLANMEIDLPFSCNFKESRTIIVPYEEFEKNSIELKCILKANTLGFEHELAAWNVADDSIVILTRNIEE